MDSRSRTKIPDHRRCTETAGSSGSRTFDKIVRTERFSDCFLRTQHFGRSEGKKINAPLYKRTIQEINKRYGPVQSYMAHSFGGMAVCLALEEISHTTDHRLVLIAPATETSSAIDSFFKFLQLDQELRPDFEKMIIKTGGAGSAWYSIKRAMKNPGKSFVGA